MKESAKEKILKAGLELFSKKGYSAVGVREIAAQAGVNISMISYYYNGKVGILKHVINDFFDGYVEIIKENILKYDDGKEAIKNIIPNLISYIKSKKQQALIVITELPLDSTEVTELKAIKIVGLKQYIEKALVNIGLPKEKPELYGIIGPVFISTIVSHFLFSPVISRVFKTESNDQFYDYYNKVITNFILGGLENIIKNQKEIA